MFKIPKLVTLESKESAQPGGIITAQECQESCDLWNRLGLTASLN